MDLTSKATNPRYCLNRLIQSIVTTPFFFVNLCLICALSDSFDIGGDRGKKGHEKSYRAGNTKIILAGINYLLKEWAAWNTAVLCCSQPQ